MSLEAFFLKLYNYKKYFNKPSQGLKFIFFKLILFFLLFFVVLVVLVAVLFIAAGRKAISQKNMIWQINKVPYLSNFHLLNSHFIYIDVRNLTGKRFLSECAVHLIETSIFSISSLERFHCKRYQTCCSFMKYSLSNVFLLFFILNFP